MFIVLAFRLMVDAGGKPSRFVVSFLHCFVCQCELKEENKIIPLLRIFQKKYIWVLSPLIQRANYDVYHSKTHNGLNVVLGSDDREDVSVGFCFHCFRCHRVVCDQHIEAKWSPFSQTTFSNALSLMKMYGFRLKCH